MNKIKTNCCNGKPLSCWGDGHDALRPAGLVSSRSPGGDGMFPADQIRDQIHRIDAETQLIPDQLGRRLALAF